MHSSILGFPLRLINLIIVRVKSIFFSILLNGVLKGPIIQSRGLWQEDPLSPCIFLLCTVGLVNLLKKSTFDKCLEGVRVCRGAPMMKHLLFVDDSKIFCKANYETSQQLLILLKTYT